MPNFTAENPGNAVRPELKRKKRETLMQRRRVEAESITHKYCNSSTKPKFYKNTRLIGKKKKKPL